MIYPQTPHSELETTCAQCRRYKKKSVRRVSAVLPKWMAGKFLQGKITLIQYNFEVCPWFFYFIFFYSSDYYCILDRSQTTRKAARTGIEHTRWVQPSRCARTTEKANEIAEIAE